MHIFYFFFGGGYRLLVYVFVIVLTHLMPLAMKMGYKSGQYDEIDKTVVAIGKPIWEFCAYLFAPLVAWLIRTFFYIVSWKTVWLDWDQLINLVHNSTPRDAAKYVEAATSMVFLAILLLLLPWVIRGVTNAAKDRDEQDI